MTRQYSGAPSKLVRFLSPQQVQVATVLAAGDVQRIKDVERTPLIVLNGFATGTQQVGSNEVSPRDPKIRNDYFSVPPKFGYSTQFTSGHPAGGSHYKRLGPAGPMLWTGLQPPFSPQFPTYGHQPFSRYLRVVHSCEFAPAPVCLEPTQGPANCTAQVTTQGLEQFVPRPDIHHRETVLPQT